MAIWKGKSGSFRRIGVEHDPDRGSSEVIQWTGTQSQMRSIVSQFRAYYPEIRVMASPYEGPVWQATAYLPYWLGGASSSPFTEQWETDTEPVEKDGFTHPNVETAIGASGLSAAKFRERMETGIANGKDFDDVGVDPNGTNTHARNLYTDMARGITGWETEYQVVTRTRSASIRFPWNRVVYSVRYIYSTDQLGIPSDLGFTFQAAPTAQTVYANMAWGWRLRRQSFTQDGGERREVVSWAFAEWSKTKYTIEPTGALF